MTSAGSETSVVDEMPQSAWVLGWACLTGQVVALLERGPADADSALLSVPLTAAVVGWVSYGVLRARMGRVWFARILMLLTALFALAALVTDPSLLTLLTASTGVLAFAALMAYTQSDFFARLRQQPQRPVPPLGGLVSLVIAVGVIGGVTVGPNADREDPGFHVRIGL